jgi:hypothetical protein
MKYGNGDDCSICSPEARSTSINVVCDAKVTGTPRISSVLPAQPVRAPFIRQCKSKGIYLTILLRSLHQFSPSPFVTFLAVAGLLHLNAGSHLVLTRGIRRLFNQSLQSEPPTRPTRSCTSSRSAVRCLIDADLLVRLRPLVECVLC